MLSVSVELIFGNDFNTFCFDPADAYIAKTTLMIINKVAVMAVKRDKRFAEPLADIMPPRVPPPPKPSPSLSDPWSKINITRKIERINWIMIKVVMKELIFKLAT